MPTFKPGDAVRIKGRSGDVMTVEKIDKLRGRELAHCRWTDAKTNKRRESVFPFSTLELFGDKELARVSSSNSRTRTII